MSSCSCYLNAIAVVLATIGIAIVVFQRATGIDLTEGQLLVQRWPWWLTAAACLIGAAWIAKRASRGRGES